MSTELVTCANCGSESLPRYRLCGACRHVLAAAAPAEIHRRATIVTSDLKGSTALGERLDPESLREVMTTYIDEMRAVFEAHGGTIEKIIGDAIVAVFGLPTAREDDALRAVEAAAETQRALVSLNDLLDERWGVRLTVRTGVASGDVVVGEASAGQHVLTGPTIALATAMEQHAPAHEVLLAASTYDEVSASVRAEQMAPVLPKGWTDAVASYRLESVAERREAIRDPVAPDDARSCRTCGEVNPEAARYCGMCGAELARIPAHRDSRKTVSIVFADPKPATADGTQPAPEALRDVMSRYFAAMEGALARHGATVEKFIGDAVMAVFGLPVRHEDDALRAVRAASDMQRILPELNAAFAEEHGITLANHIGVNTGEVVAGDASLGQRLVTGDTVNVAARLEQAAGPREILIGALTHRLVRGAVRVEEVEPLALKGKSEPVRAFRLLEVSDAVEGFQRRQDAPMVGREAEMLALDRQLARAVAERDCRLATIVADAGVGKSRLTAEFTASHAADSLVIRGRCLPYGEGITFWPLREAVRHAAGAGPDDPPEVTLARLRGLVGDEEIVARLAVASGLSDEQFAVDEIMWGARRFLETLASPERPVILVIDDIHWAEATFLELIEQLVATVAEAPVLVLCTSRHELLDAHPEWATSDDSLRLTLQPLTDADAGRVVEGLLGDATFDPRVRSRIVAAAAGNPLFVEQLLSMLVDNGTLRKEDDGWVLLGDAGRLEVPPTIEALLAARLDLLASSERAVVEPASVIGLTFAQLAVEVLAPEPLRSTVANELRSVGRKQLVALLPATESGGGSYRFLNLLIRDAAYNGLLKRSRADFHERFATWADAENERQGRSQEFEEILGYHLEQAYRYRLELGTADEAARALGQRASVKLASAGRRALGRGDAPAAASLLGRAAATLPDDALDRAAIGPDLAEALAELGRFEEAVGVLDAAIGAAERDGDANLGARARLVRLFVQRGWAEGDAWGEAVAREVDAALPVFEGAGDEAGLALAWRLRAGQHGTAGRYGAAAAANEQVIVHADGAGDRRAATRGATGLAVALLYGPMPVAEAIERCEELVEQASSDQRAVALIRAQLAQLCAMRGNFADAREHYRAARATLEDLGAGLMAASTGMDAARVELLAGDVAEAERGLRADYRWLDALGERFLLSTVGGLLARAQALAGRDDEALAMTETVEQIAAADDVDAQAIWRGVRAGILARRGETDAATRLAEEAVALRRETDSPLLQAEALADLAMVHGLAGREEARRAALAEAAGLAAAKGDLVTLRQFETATDPVVTGPVPFVELPAEAQ